jgi:ABC-type Fe3+ transport system permease subunit
MSIGVGLIYWFCKTPREMRLTRALAAAQTITWTINLAGDLSERRYNAAQAFFARFKTNHYRPSR